MNEQEVEIIRKIPMLFVLGSSRSGTTLLQEMLDSNPYIVGPPESDFILYLYPRFGKIKHWYEKDIRNFTEALFTLPRISKIWLLDKEEILKILLSIKEKADYQLLCKVIFYQKRKDKNNILLFSDKDPRNSFFAKKLLRIFPDTRFIHIVRDPRDVVNGHIRRLHKKNVFFIAMQWVGLNKSIEKIKKNVTGKFFMIKYEEMVMNPDKIFKSLCEFLNVPYGDSIMENKFAENVKDLKDTSIFARYREIHESLLKPINTSNMGKWKTEMNRYDQGVTIRITQKYAKEKYGYLIEPIDINKSKISLVKLFKSKLVYHIWERFTRIRYTRFWFNSFYRKRFLKGYGL